MPVPFELLQLIDEENLHPSVYQQKMLQSCELEASNVAERIFYLKVNFYSQFNELLIIFYHSVTKRRYQFTII